MRTISFWFALSISSALAQTSKYAGSFLEIPVGARGLGMGDAIVSIVDDGTAFHYNPAGAAYVRSDLLSMMYSSQYGALAKPLSDFFFVGYARRLQELSVAISWVRLSVEDIPRSPDLTVYDSPAQRELLVKTGGSSGYFTSADDAFYFTASRAYNLDLDLGWSLAKIPLTLPVGVNFKIIHRSLGGRNASGAGIDVGVMIALEFESFLDREKMGRLSFGMSLRDVTTTRIGWDTQTIESIPGSAAWGVSYDAPARFLKGNVTVAFSRESRYGDVMLGAEYRYKSILALRLGSYASDFTAGVGLDVDFMRVDYAFLMQDLGNVNRIGVALYLDRMFQ